MKAKEVVNAVELSTYAMQYSILQTALRKFEKAYIVILHSESEVLSLGALSQFPFNVETEVKILITDAINQYLETIKQIENEGQ